MFSKPCIGLNADYRSPQRKQPAYSAVTAGYYDAIQRAGGIPVILPPLSSEDDIRVVLDRLDGFLLVGGADLDPRRDGFMLHPMVKPMDPRREIFDRTICNLVAERKMPCLGIGAGMQLMNITKGGNLFLHIPDDLPEAMPHRDPQDPGHRHGLNIVSGSLMDRVYGDGEIRVSSRHHMAIDEVATCFDVTARCADGVIEAIESNDPEWIAIGTQFHPENDASSALDMRIFEEFIEAIREPVPQNLRLVA